MPSGQEKGPSLPQSVRDRIQAEASKFKGSVSFNDNKVRVTGDAELYLRVEII